MAEEVDPLGIAFVSSHARKGGSERYLESLIRRLGSDWTRVVVCLERGPLADRLRENGIPVEVVHSSGRPLSVAAAAWRLRAVLRRTRPALVHANGVKAALVAGLATLGTSTPVVWVKHDFSWDGPLSALIAGRCRFVVGVSEAVTRSLPRRGRVRVVPTGVDAVPAFAAAGETVQGNRIGVFGYLHPVKAQLELVEAAPRVLERVPDARFLVVGGDDPSVPGYREIVLERVRALGLEQAISFLGHREDAREIMRTCSVVTVTTLSRGEGFGLVAVEALLAGKPVVGYALGALPEVVGECGRLVEPGNRVALADALVELLENDRLRDELSRCGERRALERFSPERWIAEMRTIYREAV
ncbi:MAG: glycosyltransferase family 4 protein [Actinobacteria bacterium]|nr:glycosyltransferase family 4 protein [Actinomycetota bacterium]